MDFFEAVEKRYSHKERFLPDPVPLADLERVARAGLAAPTGNNTQCVRLVILPDRAAVQPLCDVVPTEGLLTAPAVIAVLTDASAQKGQYNFEVEDYAASAAQMLLAVTALGYASVWLDSPYFDEDKQREALNVLGAPEGYRLRVVLPVGLPDGAGSRRGKMPYEERVSYGKLNNAFLTEKLRNFLDENGKLINYPSKRKFKILSWFYLASKFESGRKYTEKEVNELLRDWHTFDDWAMLRRDLYDSRFLNRENDGMFYWLEEKQPSINDFNAVPFKHEFEFERALTIPVADRDIMVM